MILNGMPPYKDVMEPAPNSTVWRYMDFPKFVYLISNSKLYFRRLDKLSDEFEGTLSLEDEKDIQKRLESLGFPMTKKLAKNISKKDVENVENYRKYTLVNCWSQNVDESFALWKIYLGSQDYGIAIRTKYKKLKNSIVDNNFDMLFQKVYYAKKIKKLTQSSVPFRKSKYYKYEREVRIAIFDRNINFNKEPQFIDGACIEVDLAKLIEEIYISPMSPSWFFDLVHHVVKEKYNFPIIKSKIKVN